MECPLCEVIIEGNKIQLPEGLLRLSRFKGFTQDVDIAKSMEKLQIRSKRRQNRDRDEGSKDGCEWI